MISGLKIAIRSLIKTPGFALSIMPIVALGVEFNAGMLDTCASCDASRPIDSPADGVEVSHAI